MRETQLGLCSARSEPLGADGAERERGSPSRPGRTRAALVPGARGPRGRPAAPDPECQGRRRVSAPRAARVPGIQLRDATRPTAATERGKRSPGRGAQRAGLRGPLSQRGGAPALALSPDEAAGLQESESNCSPGWLGRWLGASRAGPRPVTSGVRGCWAVYCFQPRGVPAEGAGTSEVSVWEQLHQARTFSRCALNSCFS